MIQLMNYIALLTSIPNGCSCCGGAQGCDPGGGGGIPGGGGIIYGGGNDILELSLTTDYTNFHKSEVDLDS